MAVPYTFGSATTSIPLSQLDSNFATPITLGNTAIQLGNTVTSLTGLTNVYTGTLFVTGGDSSIQRNGGNTWVIISSNTGYGSNGTHLKLDSSTVPGGFYFFSQSTSFFECAGVGNTVVLQGGTPSTGTGIAFPATQSASNNANTLDDYEEGTWTPNVYHSSSNNSTWTVKSGRYLKIGSQVTCWFYCDGGNSGTAGSQLVISGIPFALSGVPNTATMGEWGANSTTPVLCGNWLNIGGTPQVYNGGSGMTTQATYFSGCFTYTA